MTTKTEENAKTPEQIADAEFKAKHNLLAASPMVKQFINPLMEKLTTKERETLVICLHEAFAMGQDFEIDRKEVMSDSLFIAVEFDGNVEVHAIGNGQYATLCGLDGGADGDEEAGQSPAPLPDNPKINCEQCKNLWLACCKYTAKDFA